MLLFAIVLPAGVRVEKNVNACNCKTRQTLHSRSYLSGMTRPVTPSIKALRHYFLIVAQISTYLPSIINPSLYNPPTTLYSPVLPSIAPTSFFNSPTFLFKSPNGGSYVNDNLISLKLNLYSGSGVS